MKGRLNDISCIYNDDLTGYTLNRIYELKNEKNNMFYTITDDTGEIRGISKDRFTLIKYKKKLYKKILNERRI